MTDIEKIILGGLIGVSIVVIGQLISKFILEPVQELRKAVGEVRFNLAFHAPTIHTPIGRTAENKNAVRQVLLSNSSSLITKLHAVPFCTILRFLSFNSLPNRKAIERASSLLRSLSTYILEEGDRATERIGAVNNHVSEIEKLIQLKPLE